MQDVPAGPRPLGVPLERVAAEPVDAGALAAGGGLCGAPEVVVDGVHALDGVVPLAAVVCALGEGGSRSGGCRQGKRSGAGDGKECGELHV